MERRDFLLNLAMGTGGLALAQMPFTKAMAAGGSSNRVLVTVFLRGGWDALNVLPPTSGADVTKYQALRPTIGLSSSQITNLSGVGFGLNKDLGVHLKPLWDAGQLALIPRAASLNSTRSHFVQQDLVESGSSEMVGKGYASSAGALLPKGDMGELAYVAFGLGTPRVFRGSPALVLDDVHTYGDLGSRSVTSAETMPEKLARYKGGDNELCDYATGALLKDVSTCKSAIISKKMFAKVDALKSQVPKILPEGFTKSNMGESFYQASQLIKLKQGVRFININQGGYDTHFDQAGKLSGAVSALGQNLKAFTDQLKADGTYNLVTIVVMSEFGRTTLENHNNGTDHGHGGLTMVLGGEVKGKAGLSYAPRQEWNLRPTETASGTSNVLEIDSQSAPQHDIRHIMARTVSHVLGVNYTTVKDVFTGVPLPAADKLKIYG
jgi:uncharacterized protein (DUF1501 family)